IRACPPALGDYLSYDLNLFLLRNSLHELHWKTTGFTYTLPLCITISQSKVLHCFGFQIRTTLTTAHSCSFTSNKKRNNSYKKYYFFHQSMISNSSNIFRLLVIKQKLL